MFHFFKVRFKRCNYKDSHDLCHQIVFNSVVPTKPETEKTTQRFIFILNSEFFDFFSSDDNRRSEMSLRFPFLDRKISTEIGTTTNVELNFESSGQVELFNYNAPNVTFLKVVKIKNILFIFFFYLINVNF